MNIFRKSYIPSVQIVRLPLLSLAMLTLLLVACSTSGTTATPGGTVEPTSPSQTGGVTPTVAPAASPSVNTGPSQPTSPLIAIRMLNAHNGWGLTASSVLRTADGGSHWQDVTPANADLNQGAKGQFMNEQYGWIALGPANQQEGAGITILRTANGGTSWQRSQINDPLVSLVDVPHFINTQQGWIELSSTPGAGSAGSDIWHSNDGGQTWAKLFSNKSSNGLNLGYVTGISFKDAQTGIAAGNLGAGGDNTVPSIAVTHDGAKSWKTISLPHLLGGYVNPNNTSQAPVFFGNIVFLPVNVAIQNDTLLVLYRSNDGGQTWVQTSAAHIQANNTYVLDATHAWATDTQSGKLYRTSDGGNHWAIASNTAYALNALSFIDAQNGWGVARNHVLRTSDGGQSWQQL